MVKMTKGIQCRVENSDYHLHIQAIGPIEENRSYGGAWEIRAPPSVIEWVAEQTPVFDSAASKKKYYIRMDVLRFDTGQQAFLIWGEPEVNHPYGLLMGCNPESVPVKSIIEYAYQTDMLVESVYNETVNEIKLPDNINFHVEKEYDNEVSEFLSMLESVFDDEESHTDDDTKYCDSCQESIPSHELVKCENCGTALHDTCYYTPEEDEAHGGAMVWCKSCCKDISHAFANKLPPFDEEEE